MPFRKRFMALSVAMHVAPVVALPWFRLSDSDVSPPPTRDPIGVSLVYAPSNPAGSLLVDDARRGRGAVLEPDEREQVRFSALQMMAPEQFDRSLEASLQQAQPKLTTGDASSSERCEGESSSGDESEPVEEARPEDRERVRAYLAGVLVDVALAERDLQSSRLAQESEPIDTQPMVPVEPSAAVANAWRAHRRTQSDSTAEDEDDSLRGLHCLGSTLDPCQHQPQQDREEAIRRIHERIKKVMPMVYWDPARKNERAGRAVIRFRLTQAGYATGFELVDSSGDLRIDEAAQAVLHLAEPYVYVPGWIELALTFRG